MNNTFGQVSVDSSNVSFLVARCKNSHFSSGVGLWFRTKTHTKLYMVKRRENLHRQRFEINVWSFI